MTRDLLVRIDLNIVRFIHSHNEPYLTTAVRAFVFLLSPEVLLTGALSVGLVLIFLARKKRGIFLLTFSGVVLITTAFGTGVLAMLLKLLFHRSQPPISLRLVHEAGYGFPSSHAVAAVAVGAAVWYVVSLRSKANWFGSWRAKARLGLGVLALALLVGLGRVYLGAHYPSGVLAGWALGGVWASVCLTVAETFRRLRERKVMMEGTS